MHMRIFFHAALLAAAFLNVNAQDYITRSALPFTIGNYSDEKAKSIERTFRGFEEFLASDVTEGRAPGSHGEEVATGYIKTQFELMGLEPGNNGSFLQKVPIVGIRTDSAASLHAKGKKGEATFRYFDDFVAFTEREENDIEINTDIVFVGYGITAPEHRWDDFKKTDVRGKVLLIMNDNPHSFAGKIRTYYGRWTYKYEEAARRGAVGAIIIHTDQSASYPWQVVQHSWTSECYTLSTQGNTNGFKMNSWLTGESSKKLVSLGGFDLQTLIKKAMKRNFRPVPLNVHCTVSMKNTVRRIDATNVIALLRGSDPNLKDEYLIYTAHHDHFGIGRPVNGDSIYNGALDNAAGVSTLLSVARCFMNTTPKPKRSILFCTVTGEEAGLLGSGYLAHHLPVPHDSVIADINIEGAGILGPARDVIQTGMGHSTIDYDIDATTQLMKLLLRSEPRPEDGNFFRSDHFSFAQVGIPPAYIETGEDIAGKPKGWGKEMNDKYIEKIYHQPGDEIQPWWNYEGVVQSIQLQYLLGLRLADKPSRPAWNKGDEFGRKTGS